MNEFIENKGDKEKKEIIFQKLGNFDTNSIIKVSNLFYIKNHIAILTDKSLFIYDFEVSLDDPEIKIDLNQNLKVIDFCFSKGIVLNI